MNVEEPMRSIAQLVLPMIIVPLLSTRVPTSAQEPLSLSVTAVEQTVRIGSEVRVKTKLTNTTKHTLNFYDTNRDCDYPVDVRDDRGNRAPETAYKRQLRCNGRLTDARNILITLKPKQSTEDELVLTRLYDLNRPGNYLVQVWRQIPKEVGKGPIRSNTVTLTMTD